MKRVLYTTKVFGWDDLILLLVLTKDVVGRTKHQNRITTKTISIKVPDDFGDKTYQVRTGLVRPIFVISSTSSGSILKYSMLALMRSGVTDLGMTTMHTSVGCTFMHKDNAKLTAITTSNTPIDQHLHRCLAILFGSFEDLL